jgi:hypothetical protein
MSSFRTSSVSHMKMAFRTLKLGMIQALEQA